VKVSEVLRLLKDDGWTLKNQQGSHRQFVHETKAGKVTVAGKPSVDVPKGTLNSILRQAGLKQQPPSVDDGGEGEAGA
jgi:predicted RNA binding protein YcfA (HicA-like mRNA interferase family)